MTFGANVHVMSLAPGKNKHVDQLLHKHPNISKSSASCQIKNKEFDSPLATCCCVVG